MFNKGAFVERIQGMPTFGKPSLLNSINKKK
jgi:hypothetical protein